MTTRLTTRPQVSEGISPAKRSWRSLVFYELYVRAYRDTDGDGHGDILGVIEKLDYLQWLGVDVVWLLPIYPSPLRDDGYDVADFYAVHEQFGTLEQVKLLLDEAHARGLKVITDLVLNHTSDQHPWFQESRRDRTNPKADWYVWTDDPTRYSGTRIIFIDTETSNWTFDEQRGQYYWHRFFHHQPDLNFDNPAVRAEMKRVVRFWLELGFDGFRLDAIPYLFERDGTDNENLPETHAFLKELRAYVDSFAPGALLVGEVNQWPEDTAAYFGAGDELKLLFHFPVMPRIYLALAEGSYAPIERVLARTPQPPPGCDWVVFLRNHDELTLEMVDERERQLLWAHYAPEPRMRLNLGIRRRLAPLLDNDRRRLELVNALLLTLPGAPILYYGDEIGMGDDISLPDRDGVRTPMQWSAERGAGFSRALEPYAPVVADAVYGFRQVNVTAQQDDPGSLLHFIRELLRKRQGLRAISQGACSLLYPQNRALLVLRHRLENSAVPAAGLPLEAAALAAAPSAASTATSTATSAATSAAARARGAPGQARPGVAAPGQEVTAIYNLSGEPQEAEWRLFATPTTSLTAAPTVVAASSNWQPALSAGEALRLPPYGFVWLTA